MLVLDDKRTCPICGAYYQGGMYKDICSNGHPLIQDGNLIQDIVDIIRQNTYHMFGYHLLSGAFVRIDDILVADNGIGFSATVTMTFGIQDEMGGHKDTTTFKTRLTRDLDEVFNEEGDRVG